MSVQEQSPVPVSIAENSQDPSIEAPPQAQAPSKNALKKAAKQERWQAAKLERRAREKEVKKAKKKLLAEKRAAGELDDDEDQKRSAKRRRLHFGGRVVVDLGFDDMMNEKEIKSLTSQLAYTYSANRQADYPFSLLFTSLNGRTSERLDSLGDADHRRWANAEWWTEGYDRLWASGSSSADTSAAGLGSSSSVPATHDSPDPVPTPEDIRQKVVYLTADTDEELTELKPDEIYIIGGIVDHNRYKNLCLNKANGHGIRTAKLPIGRYLSNLPTRKVLTVNQCFEILLKWVETRDWEQALYSVIPQRKFKKPEGDGKVVIVEASAIETAEGAEKVEEDKEKEKDEEETVAGEKV